MTASSDTNNSAATGVMILRTLGEVERDFAICQHKISLGSDPNCTVTLVGDDIEPVHCLILRSPKGAVIRSWAKNCWLNGSQFEDSPIRPGDVLKIAEMQLEVVCDLSDSTGAVIGVAAHSHSKSAEDSAIAKDAFDSEVLPTTDESIDTSFETGQKFEAKVEGCEAKVENESCDLSAPLDRTESTIDQFAAAFENPLEDATPILEANFPVEEASAPEAAMDVEPELPSPENNASIAPMVQPERTEENRVIEDIQAAVPSAPQSPAPPSSPAVQKLGEDPVDDSAPEYEDAFERLKMNSQVESESEHDAVALEAASNPPTEQAEVTYTPVESQAVAKEPLKEDDSIQDYMNQLLQRVGADPSSINVIPDPTEAPRESAPLADETEDVAASKANWPRAPQAKQVERTTDMSKLRELANHSSRTAITRHARSTRKRATLSRFVSAIAAGLGGLIMLTLSRFENLMFMLGGFAMLGLCLYLLLLAVKAGVFNQVNTNKVNNNNGGRAAARPLHKRKRRRRR